MIFTGHSRRKNKMRQTEEAVRRQYKRVERNGICQLSWDFTTFACDGFVIEHCLFPFLARLFLKKASKYCHSPGVVAVVVRRHAKTLTFSYISVITEDIYLKLSGWSGGAMALSNLPVPGRPSYNLDDSRARAYCACSRRGWGLFGHFNSHLSFLSSYSLSLGDGPI